MEKRELKFKVFDSQLNEMSNPFTFKEIIRFDRPDGNFSLKTLDLECHTIFQYIGLKDKNGIDIYDGDTLQLANNEPYGDIEPGFKGVVTMIEGCWLVNSGYAAHKVWQEIAEWEIVKTD